MTESLGWLATTVFVSSYFFRSAGARANGALRLGMPGS